MPRASRAFCLDGISWCVCSRGAANNTHEETFVRISDTLEQTQLPVCRLVSITTQGRPPWLVVWIWWQVQGGQCSWSSDNKHVQKCYIKVIMMWPQRSPVLVPSDLFKDDLCMIVHANLGKEDPVVVAHWCRRAQLREIPKISSAQVFLLMLNEQNQN